jgi:hypothetical protein
MTILPFESTQPVKVTAPVQRYIVLFDVLHSTALAFKITENIRLNYIHEDLQFMLINNDLLTHGAEPFLRSH